MATQNFFQSPDSLDLAVAHAEKEKKLEEAIRDKMKAQKEQLEAKLPSTEGKGLKGSVKLNEGSGYYAEILSYQTLKNAADKITEDICDSATNCDAIVVTDRFDLAQSAALWQIIDVKLTALSEEIKKLVGKYSLNSQGEYKPPEATVKSLGLALWSIPAFLGAATEIAAFFKEDREISSRTVSLDNRALIANVASALKDKFPNKAILIPSLSFDVHGSLFSKLQNLLSDRRTAIARKEKVREHYQNNLDKLFGFEREKVRKETELARLDSAPTKSQARIDKLRKEIDDLAEQIENLYPIKEVWENITEQFDPLIKAVETLVEMITKRPPDGKSPLETVAEYDLIKSKEKAKILSVDIVSQGAEIEIAKNIWKTDKVSYIGGSVVAYFLTALDGGYEKSGAISFHLATSFYLGNTPP